ncbi:efflux RND transporter periplasmic adaptor subunit [Lachnobacterium bovis]|uniref:Multidrug resistance efflux pump n=1 Tax=Lachnobacterium bovis TaxID=140626 RepID=A0A1H9S332_9FIRM|nr:HlyD family efflux transporter periplasmic adaptor subunit [Lachnobacterium bovis]SER79035.1 Multidrug resistance efflux pump [Lachnobacterium bovis]
MHNKVKTGIIALISIIGIVGVILGIIYGVSFYQKSKMHADVREVSNLNMGYNNGELTSEGYVTSDKSQSVMLSKEQVIKEVYVQKGQQVKAGDKLIAFDVESVAIAIEKEKVAQSLLDVKIQKAKGEIESLKRNKVEAFPSNKVDTQKYNKVEVSKASNDMESNDSDDEENESNIEKDIAHDKNTQDKSDNLYDEKSSEDDSLDKNTQDNDIPYNSDKEIDEAIKEQEKTIKGYEIDMKKSQLHLKQLEKEIQDGVVYAKFDGVVKKVGNKEKPLSDGSVFLIITANEGIHVEGYLSELQIKNIKIGQKVVVSSYDKPEEEYKAKIDNIDKNPASEKEEIYLEGNPNVSKYKFRAFIKESKELKEGDPLNLAIKVEGNNKENRIVIEQSYVRTDEETPYVFVSVDGRLQKRYVQTGKIIEGSNIEIKSGLKMSDKIAFPYGKTIREGVKTRIAN